MKLSLLLTFSLLLLSKTAYQQTRFNGDFEVIDPRTNTPSGLAIGYDTRRYSLLADSMVKLSGKYSLLITSIADQPVTNGDTTPGSGAVSFIIPTRYWGKEIELRGYIKTDNVSNHVGLWLRINGVPVPASSRQQIKGTQNWKEYTIKIPYYDSDNAMTINAGVIFAGTGKIWIDNLRLYIDGKPIDNAMIIRIPKAQQDSFKAQQDSYFKNRTVVKPIPKAQQDTAFRNGSLIDTVLLDQQRTQNLTILGQLWGFLKYHHPAVANGEFNVDAELFRVLPKVLAANSSGDMHAVLEKWVDGLGKPSACASCKPPSGNDIAHLPDYGSLLDPAIFGRSLTEKLQYIKDNNNSAKHYYISDASGMLVFTNEQGHRGMPYPDAGYRLLSLFRYWNMIQYFSPYKHLIGEDWNKVLPKFIPKFVHATNEKEYVFAVLELITSTNDGHATILSTPKPTLEQFQGKYRLPFQAKFIENKLTVTGYYSDILDVKQKLKPGDVITAINGVKVTTLIERFLPLIPASNYSGKLNEMPDAFLLRSDNKSFTLELEGKNPVMISAVESLNTDIDYDPNPGEPGFKLLNKQTGYVFAGRYKSSDMPKIRKMFARTKGIIVDLRCYPSDFMPNAFGPYIKTSNTGFARLTKGSIANPGLFRTGAQQVSAGENEYKGKVVVIVNAQTYSQSEYTTMAFQASPNVTVIGSTTAGMDGDAPELILPGGVSTMFSTIGVLYPDGTESQRKGVKIDLEVKPTIEGIKAGRDELLEKAMELILK